MTEVTNLLQAIECGDQQAADRLFPLVYEELRRLARSKLRYEKPGQTLQATDLVHVAYLRMVGSKEKAASELKWNSRGHFFAAAAEAMRRILVDRARARKSLKRGGDLQRVDMESIEHPAAHRPEKLIALDGALDRLEQLHAQKAELVKLRFFAGLTNRQAAVALGISESTADRHWAFSRAWLQREMEVK